MPAGSISLLCFCNHKPVAVVQVLELSAGSGLCGTFHVDSFPCSDTSGGRASHQEGDTLDIRHMKGTGGTKGQRQQ